MNKIKKKCPFSGENFIPKRNNQIYASAYNRITYNNIKNRKLQKIVKPINKRLLKNYKIIVELLEDKQELISNSEFLKGKGFDFSILTHIMKEGNTSIYGIYNYAFFKLDNNTIKIKKQ